MAAKTPLALVKEKFGEKSKLVEAVEKLTQEGLWLSRTNEHKGLAHVSNAKLLRLHATFTEVEAKFGTREKLIEAILELEKKGKDAGWRQRLAGWPVPRLFDAYRSAAKRNGKGSPSEAPAAREDAKTRGAAAAGARESAPAKDKKASRATKPSAARKGAGAAGTVGNVGAKKRANPAR